MSRDQFINSLTDKENITLGFNYNGSFKFLKQKSIYEIILKTEEHPSFNKFKFSVVVNVRTEKEIYRQLDFSGTYEILFDRISEYFMINFENDLENYTKNLVNNI